MIKLSKDRWWCVALRKTSKDAKKEKWIILLLYKNHKKFKHHHHNKGKLVLPARIGEHRGCADDQEASPWRRLRGFASESEYISSCKSIPIVSSPYLIKCYCTHSSQFACAPLSKKKQPRPRVLYTPSAVRFALEITQPEQLLKSVFIKRDYIEEGRLFILSRIASCSG